MLELWGYGSMESLKFKQIESNLSNILTTIVVNQNLLRYVIYLSESIGDNPLDTNKTDIILDDSIMSNSFLLTPTDPSIMTNEVVKIFINPLSGNLKPRPLGKDVYVIDIVVPLRYWTLKGLGLLRPFRIAHEISTKIDGLNIAGFGQVEITDYKVSRINDKFSCLTLFVEVKSATIKS